MSMRRMPAGSSTTVNRLFRAHPIRTPAIFVVAGVVMIGVWLFITEGAAAHPAVHTGALSSGLTLGLGIVLIAVGLITLPFGIVRAVWRHSHPVALRCPSCGLVSGEGGVAFRVERPGHVEYSIVTCPRCHWQFTADKYARLA